MPTQHNYLPIDRCRVSVFVSVHIEKVTISGVLIWPLRMFPSWSFANISFFQPHAFLMIGITGLETVDSWISILFSFMYTVALTGNCLILLAVRRTPSLHKPMYYFLSMLALIDMGLTLATMPTTLCSGLTISSSASMPV